MPQFRLNNLHDNKKEEYLYGKCNIFAYVLHTVTKLPVFALTEDRTMENNPTSEGLVHAFCVKNKTITIDDDTEVIDACGIRKFKEIKKDYYFNDRMRIKNYENIHDLLSYGYPGSLAEDADIDLEILEAKHYLQKYLILTKEI